MCSFVFKRMGSESEFPSYLFQVAGRCGLGCQYLSARFPHLCSGSTISAGLWQQMSSDIKYGAHCCTHSEHSIPDLFLVSWLFIMHLILRKESPAARCLLCLPLLWTTLCVHLILAFHTLPFIVFSLSRSLPKRRSLLLPLCYQSILQIFVCVCLHMYVYACMRIEGLHCCKYSVLKSFTSLLISFLSILMAGWFHSSLLQFIMPRSSARDRWLSVLCFHLPFWLSVFVPVVIIIHSPPPS